jgi:proteic killer suppression protein
MPLRCDYRAWGRTVSPRTRRTSAQTVVSPPSFYPQAGGWHYIPSSGTLGHHGWDACMIVSFRDAWLRDFFVEDVRAKKIPADLEARLFRKLQMLDDATTDSDLRVPPSNHFEKLKGALADWHSIRVNQQWRLVFRWHGGSGEASGVYLDNHSYR